MDKKINIYQIALDCAAKTAQDINDKGSCFKYKDTIYAFIDDNNELLISETPDILRKEKVCQCIMIHRHERKEVSNWYSWYTVQFIDKDGCVLTDKLDERFKLHVNYVNHFWNQWMYLLFDGKCIFSLKWPNIDKLQDVWNLYLKCKCCDTEREAQLLGELAKKDMSIFSLTSEVANLNFTAELLKQERNLYRSLLDEITGLVRNK